MKHNTDDGVKIPSVDISVFFDEYYHKEDHETINIPTKRTMPVSVSKDIINNIAPIQKNTSNIRIPPIRLNPTRIETIPNDIPNPATQPITDEEPNRLPTEYIQVSTDKQSDLTAYAPRTYMRKSALQRRTCINNSIVARQKRRSPSGVFLPNMSEMLRILPQELDLITDKCQMQRETRTYDLCEDVKVRATYHIFAKNGKTLGLFVKSCYAVKECPVRIERKTKSRTSFDDTMNKTVVENYTEYKAYVEKENPIISTRKTKQNELKMKVFKVEVPTSMYFL